MEILAIVALIHQKAIEHSCDPELLQAIVQIESAYNPNATRYEPNYKWIFHPRDHAEALGIKYEDELRLQMSSLGLAQVMGALARELGLKEHLTELLKPKANLDYACKYLRKLMVRYGSNEASIISAYNAGTAKKRLSGMYYNQTYVDKVSRVLEDIRRAREGKKGS